MLKKNISRRDFLNNTLLAAGGSLLASSALANAQIPLGSKTYPPLLSGMRGSNNASYQYAHSLAIGGRKDFGQVQNIDKEYDLIVVGGGISGLAAAYFYRKINGADKKILILDNHDDFGGHARRNEFTINDKTYLNYGGSQTMDERIDNSAQATVMEANRAAGNGRSIGPDIAAAGDGGVGTVAVLEGNKGVGADDPGQAARLDFGQGP